MLDIHIKENGYEEISPPLIANEDSMYGTGQLPKFENDQFELKIDEKNDRKFLIPTAEVILTNIVKDKKVNHMDAIVIFCEKNDVEPQDVKKFITKTLALK